MKRIISIMLVLLMAFCFTSCGGSEKQQQPKEYEIAMIADTNEIEDGSFTEAAWNSVKQIADANGVTSKCYMPKESTREGYLAAIEKAVGNKAGLVVLAGSNFETAAFNAQTLYPEVYFLLIDGIPHDPGEKYGAAANTIGVIFAEEEAGYLAGYAAVKEGYSKLAFMGGDELPSVKRYGYGFVQGAADASAELKKKIELRYEYMGTFEPSDDVQKKAGEWYKDGTEVIFACGGGMGTSVMAAAENSRGKVIGVDVDQSYLSNTVITSAQKEIDVVITDMVENYIDGKFIGGTAFNYTAQNGGVSLQMDKAKFSKFNKNDYDKVLSRLKNDKIQLKKDTGVKSVKELTGEWITIK